MYNLAQYRMYPILVKQNANKGSKIHEDIKQHIIKVEQKKAKNLLS